MKTAAEFNYASPAMRAEMINDGVLSVSASIAKIASELRVLNGWLAVGPSYIACGKMTAPDFERLTGLLNSFGSNTDDLTYQLSENAEKLNELLKYVEKIVKV